MKSILEKHWPIMDRSSSTRQLLDFDILIGHRHPKNLSDWLCRSDVRLCNPFGITNKFPYCPHPGRCTHCPRLNKTGYVRSHSTNRKYKCMKKISCRSSNLIYCIQCKLCGLQYVGQKSFPWDAGHRPRDRH